MKVTVERADLLRSLSHVHRVVERRNTIPILANVLVRADGRNWRSRPPTSISKWSKRFGRGQPGRRDHRSGAHVL